MLLGFRRWHTCVPAGDPCGSGMARPERSLTCGEAAERVRWFRLWAEVAAVCLAVDFGKPILHTYFNGWLNLVVYTIISYSWVTSREWVLRFGWRWYISSQEAHSNWLLHWTHLYFGIRDPHSSHLWTLLAVPKKKKTFHQLNINFASF